MDIRLTREPLSLDEAARAVSDPRLGAFVVFSGNVRDKEDGLPIGAIEYEAYENMARRVIAESALTAQRRHGAKVAVFHRLGPVSAGEASVLVAAAAVHRAEAFAACREVIDALKENAPIWKTSFVPAEAVG